MWQYKKDDNLENSLDHEENIDDDEEHQSGEDNYYRRRKVQKMHDQNKSEDEAEVDFMYLLSIIGKKMIWMKLYSVQHQRVIDVNIVNSPQWQSMEYDNSGSIWQKRSSNYNAKLWKFKTALPTPGFKFWMLPNVPRTDILKLTI